MLSGSSSERDESKGEERRREVMRLALASTRSRSATASQDEHAHGQHHSRSPLQPAPPHASPAPQLDKYDSSADAQVTRQDQDRINAFSRLNSRTDEIVDILDALVKQREDLEEVETELELVDDDDQVMSVSPLSLSSAPTACPSTLTSARAGYARRNARASNELTVSFPSPSATTGPTSPLSSSSPALAPLSPLHSQQVQARHDLCAPTRLGSARAPPGAARQDPHRGRRARGRQAELRRPDGRPQEGPVRKVWQCVGSSVLFSRAQRAGSSACVLVGSPSLAGRLD